jgi:hypothetical protein
VGYESTMVQRVLFGANPKWRLHQMSLSEKTGRAYPATSITGACRASDMRWLKK